MHDISTSRRRALDPARRLAVVDPDDHHLVASLGAAAENLAIAAAARGLHAEARFAAEAGRGVSLTLDPAAPAASPLFEAIPHRQSSRTDYDGKPVPPDTLRALEAAGSSDDVDLILLTDKRQVEAVLALILEGNTAQIDDAAFMAELKRWIRFNELAALASRHGLFAAASGNPTVPSWLGRLIFGFVVTAKGENERIVRQVRSSAGLAIFVAKADDPPHWLAAGRACQRFALQATALGLKHAFLNQTVEVPAMRERLAAELGMAERRPDIVMRFGHGPEMPWSLRRPVGDVIV